MQSKQATGIRREQIAHAALEIAAEHGVAGITAKRVAERIGLAPSALYRHYAGKADIIAAILDMVEQRQRENIAEALAADDPLEGLHALLLGVTAIIRSHKALPLLFPSEEIWSGPPAHQEQVRQGLEHYTGAIAELVRRAQQTGQVDPALDPAKVVVLFFGLYVPPALFALRMPQRFSFEDHVAFNWKLFVRAIAP